MLVQQARFRLLTDGLSLHSRSTLVQEQNTVLAVTVVKRESGYSVTDKVSTKTADLAIIQALKPFQAKHKTLAYDNGKGLCGHAKMDDALDSTGHFSRPFACWERGSNKNFNGLLRHCANKISAIRY